MSTTQTLKINMDDFLYTLKEDSLSSFISKADDMAPSIVEYNLSSLFEDNLYSNEEIIVPYHKIQKVFPFDSIQILIDYNEEIYLRKIIDDDKMTFSLF